MVMANIKQFYFKATWFDECSRCERCETGFIAAETAGDAYARCEEYYGSEFVGAYLEPVTDAIMLVDENVCHDIMEDQF